MRLQGKPNESVTKTIRKYGRTKRAVIFKFDANGYVDIDETKFSKIDLEKILKKFKQVDLKSDVKPSKITDELNEDNIRQLAKTKKIKSWHVKSIETLLKELGGLDE